jgi:hypothetical protein
MNQPTKYNHEIEPLARIQGDGTVVFSPEFTKELEEAHGLTYVQVQPTNDTNKRDWIKWAKPKCTKLNDEQRPPSTPFLGRGLSKGPQMLANHHTDMTSHTESLWPG